MLKHLAEVWDQPDHGIWERRGEPQALCLLQGDDLGRLRPRHQERRDVRLQGAARCTGARLRDAIHRDVCEKGFDAEQNAFVESYGSKLLDASVLLLPAVGFLPRRDPRIRGTIAAIEKHMMRDGFVLRHDPREVSERDSSRSRAPSSPARLWLADAHVLAGDLDKAQTLFDRVVGIANDRRPAGRRI